MTEIHTRLDVIAEMINKLEDAGGGGDFELITPLNYVNKDREVATVMGVPVIQCPYVPTDTWYMAKAGTHDSCPGGINHG